MVLHRLLLRPPLVLALCASSPLASQQSQPQQEFAPLIDVRSSFLPEALSRLDSLGFRNVRVAQQWMDDMPSGVVLWQYPVPTVETRGERWPITEEIVLIVVRPYPVVPDLSRWLPDHALTLLRALELNGAFTESSDTTGGEVVYQSVNPGPVSPGGAVLLGAAPRSTAVPVRDTVFRTDTIYEFAPPERAGLPIPVVVLITLGAIGIGAATGAAATSMLRKPAAPRLPEASPSSPSSPSSPPTVPPEARPGARPPRFGVAAFEPVIIDEVVWVTRGRARAEGGTR